MGWLGTATSEWRSVVFYTRTMTEREKERKEKLTSREVEEVNGMTGLIAKEERESQLSVTFSCFRSFDWFESIELVGEISVESGRKELLHLQLNLIEIECPFNKRDRRTSMGRWEGSSNECKNNRRSVRTLLFQLWSWSSWCVRWINDERIIKMTLTVEIKFVASSETIIHWSDQFMASRNHRCLRLT